VVYAVANGGAQDGIYVSGTLPFTTTP